MSWSKELFSSKKQDWATPQYLFDYFNDKYCFGLDAAATAGNSKCERFIPPESDALSINWAEEYPDVHAVWLNPPYGRGVGKWMEHCYTMALRGHQLIAALIMARTDTRWWHEYCMKAQQIYLIKGRVKFIGSDGVAGNAAPAPSAVVVWRNPPPRSVRYTQYSPSFRSCRVHPTESWAAIQRKDGEYEPPKEEHYRVPRRFNG